METVKEIDASVVQEMKERYLKESSVLQRLGRAVRVTLAVVSLMGAGLSLLPGGALAVIESNLNLRMRVNRQGAFRNEPDVAETVARIAEDEKQEEKEEDSDKKGKSSKKKKKRRMTAEERLAERRAKERRRLPITATL